MLLEKEEQDLVKGLVINKFRGDKTILDPGIAMLEQQSRKPVVGVVPYMDIDVEDEDSPVGASGRDAGGEEHRHCGDPSAQAFQFYRF